MRQPIEQIAAHLRELGCPQDVITRHLDALRKSRRVKRRRVIRVQEDGRQLYAFDRALLDQHELNLAFRYPLDHSEFT